ncbi:hypothetical protein [Chromobacterium sp. IIBBL 290-4]|uniref:hypothetical protein n=1 Tax=Chromobacterium sp. IIBBL 290-4 TaxID=2953890 RepID=UPI0020B7679F|nr:hypothetical protein [Chromobacterium sp. IIBBL 290-4]UTH76186.1 hypothetical protein NKT35_08830 [Chromobacterium sp. IIBBL 290-4]
MKRWIACLALLGGLSGCVVAPPYVAPAPVVVRPAFIVPAPVFVYGPHYGWR